VFVLIGGNVGIDVIARHLLLGNDCDNCWHQSLNDPICMREGGQFLADENVCEFWASKFKGPPTLKDVMEREG
jgi:hypothetical protein